MKQVVIIYKEETFIWNPNSTPIVLANESVLSEKIFNAIKDKISDEYNVVPVTNYQEELQKFQYKGMDDIDAVMIDLRFGYSGTGNELSEGRGWSCCVGYSSSDYSHLLAKCMYKEAAKTKLPIDGDAQIQKEDYSTLRNILIPAVVVKNLYRDNVEDIRLLKSDTTIDTLAEICVRAIDKFFSIIE